MIYTFIAYAPKEHNKDVAWICNHYMSLLPNDDDWACFIDHDAVFTTKTWFHQMTDIIEKNPEFSCFTGMTNKVYASWQIPQGVDGDNHDITYHRKIGARLEAKNYGQVLDVTDCSESLLLPQPKAPPRDKAPLSDVVLLYKKSAWKEVPFRRFYKQDDMIMYGVDNMLHLDLKKKGYKVGLMTGIYLYHWHGNRAENAAPKDSPEGGSMNVPNGLKWIKDAQFETEKKDEVGMDIKAALYKIKKCNGGDFIIIGVPLPYTRNIDLLTCLWIEYQKRKDNMMALYEPTRFASFGRNNVIYKTLEHLPGATHIFFVDNDVVPPVDAIERLLAHDKDIVVGATPIYKGRPVWSVMKYDPEETVDNVFKPIPYTELPDKLFRAHHFGATTVLIKRRVLETMQFPWYQDVFAPGVLILGQDLFFTAAAKRLGFELWCDPTVQCEHIRQSEMKSVFDKCLEIQNKELIDGA